MTDLKSALSTRYEIDREIGRGGMATVYLARDLKHGRPVALKVLDPELAAVLGVERFLSEIRVTANLQHPHLLPLFDSGEAAGRLFYVMPFVEGESLRARLDRERQLPISEALRVTTAILTALEYAHRHGVIHRDLKPENVLMQHGEPVIADFGIALAVSNAGGARITQTGLSLGTPQYMSPEQATGDRTIDARSDIYSAGAMLYEMLAGEPPHVGGTVQAVIAKVITERPRSLRVARDTVPEYIDDAVMTALAKLPADRFESARDFADALRGGAVARLSALPRVASPMAKARAGTWASSIGFWRAASIVLLAAAAVGAWAAFRRPQPAPSLQLARQLTFEGDVVGSAISADGAWLAYVADDCFGKDFVCTKTLQVREVDGTQSVKLLTWRVIASNLRWSPDGTTVGFVGAGDSLAASLYLVPRLGGAPQRVGPAPSAWAFAPDGRVLEAAGVPGKQWLVWVDPHTMARGDSAALPARFEFRDLDVRRDGRRIAAVATNSIPVLMLLDARGKMLDTATLYYPHGAIRWDGSQSAFLVSSAAPGVADNLVRVPIHGDRIDAARTTVALGQVTNGSDGMLDVARTGRVLAVAGPTSFEVLVRRLDDPHAAWTALVHHTAWQWGSDISPDGKSIVGSATDNLGDNAYVFPLDSGAPRAVTGLSGLRDYPFWSPDGQHVAYDGGALGGALLGAAFTDVAGGRERKLPIGMETGRVSGWFGNDAIVLVERTVITVVDTLGRIRSRLALPDSLRLTTIRAAVDSRRGRVAYWSAGSNAVVVADLSTGRLTPVLRTAAIPAGWASDGTLFVATAERNGARRVVMLQKLAPGARSLVPVAPLPSGCWVDAQAVIVGAGGSIVACTVRHYGPDVWLAQ